MSVRHHVALTLDTTRGRIASMATGADETRADQGSLIPDVARADTSGFRDIGVQLFDEDTKRAMKISAQLRARLHASVVVCNSGRAIDASQSPHMTADVSVVALELPPCGGLIVANDILASTPGAEVVLFSCDDRSPESQAARSLALPRIIPADRLEEWLIDAVPHLANAARARRTLEACLAAVPPPPAYSPMSRPDEPSRSLPLLEAERRFREQYLLSMLAETGCRSETARRAGVPYRTLCQMITKLGIGLPRRSGPPIRTGTGTRSRSRR